MNGLKSIRTFLTASTLMAVSQPVQALAPQNPDRSSTSVQHTPAERDGQHDFDFEIGTWKTHLRRLLHPLTGSTTWVEYEALPSSERFGMAAPIWWSSWPTARQVTSKV